VCVPNRYPKCERTFCGFTSIVKSPIGYLCARCWSEWWMEIQSATNTNYLDSQGQMRLDFRGEGNSCLYSRLLPLRVFPG
jgi:hypothetical protein